MKISFRGADPNNKEFLFNLYLEFYSQGNIILTDFDDITLALLRDHIFTESEKVKKDFKYPLHLCAPMDKNSLE